MGQTDSPVEILFTEKHQVLSESNVISGKTNPGETTAQIAFPSIKSGRPKTRDKNLNLKLCHENTVFDHSESTDGPAMRIKDN